MRVLLRRKGLADTQRFCDFRHKPTPRRAAGIAELINEERLRMTDHISAPSGDVDRTLSPDANVSSPGHRDVVAKIRQRIDARNKELLKQPYFQLCRTNEITRDSGDDAEGSAAQPCESVGLPAPTVAARVDITRGCGSEA